MLQTTRWLPGHKVIFVGDSSFATHELSNSISKRGTLISRFRLDAKLVGESTKPKGRGRPEMVGDELPKPKNYLNAPDKDWT